MALRGSGFGFRFHGTRGFKTKQQETTTPSTTPVDEIVKDIAVLEVFMKRP